MIVERPGDLHELVSEGLEHNPYASRPVAGTLHWRLVLESRVYWRMDADVVVLGRLHLSNPCLARYQFVLVPRNGFLQAGKPSETCAFGIMSIIEVRC